jgi:4-hydroxy-3-methylbut-2-enyl diphosphate reductase
MVNIEIDEGSGFCFGVTTAIRKAEEELAKGNTLYCLGDIGCLPEYGTSV